MLAQFRFQRLKRRGVILIVILGMLGLLALIGVTFATLTGQAKVNSRNFMEAQAFPDGAEMFDFALEQLINDTGNPLSAIRGHSLARDMYGNDASNNGFLNGDPSSGLPIFFTAAQASTVGQVTVQAASGNNPSVVVNLSGTIQAVTNISLSTSTNNTLPASDFFGFDFTRWIVQFPGQLNSNGLSYLVGQSYEILFDDSTGLTNGTGNRVFYLAPQVQNTSNTPNVMLQTRPVSSPINTNVAASQLIGDFFNISGTALAPIGIPLVLDGRFLRAFNGPGMGMDTIGITSPFDGNSYAVPRAALGNFRLNGQAMTLAAGATWNTNLASTPVFGDPNAFGMDEDYDACDLENWFLAIQSADGQVIIPSFHRPAIIRASSNTAGAVNDWQSPYWDSAARILRPRQIDGHSQVSFPDLTPDPNTGKITYDVDNDGDGVTDSVWLDLGYPPQRDAEGQLFKPLFAFTVIGLNGRMPLNTVGNLQHRYSKNTDTSLYTYPYQYNLSLAGQPAYAHASHLGNSPSEIDPTFALQNADDRTNRILYLLGMQGNGQNVPLNYTQFDNSDPNNGTPNNNLFSSNYSGIYPSTVLSYMNGANIVNVPNLAMPVNLTQLRNILAGTRPQDNPLSPTGINLDTNFLFFNGLNYFLPNGVYDGGDVAYSNNTFNNPNAYVRGTPPIAGRWGESSNVPQVTGTPYFNVATGTGTAPVVGFPYSNYVRAGVSSTYQGSYFDSDDDNFDTTDPFPPAPFAEGADYYDLSGSLSLPVERIRRFLTPIDAAGDGMITQFNSGSNAMAGADHYGRVVFFKYFRPPGLPMVFNPNNTANPILPPSATATTTPPNTPPYGPFDVTNNIYHGYETFRNPQPPGNASSVPSVANSGGALQLLMAGGPADLPSGTVPPVFTNNGNVPGFTPAVPSFDVGVNSNPFFLSPNLNDADEMQLYTTNGNDAPFGPADLQWLYRQQDVDGASLSSRLSQLAPISFTNPLDGLKRRRLFCTDTWEPTNFVWANDNPKVNNSPLGVYNSQGDFSPNVASGFVGNNRFYPPSYTSPTLTLSYSDLNNSTYFNQVNTNASLLALGQANATNNANPVSLTNFATPSLAHRDRKINLNYPLPVSDNPNEPTRQKWITETLHMMMQVLPPLAVDTPDEVAQLSQYLVNVIDFRDPDATMTHFVNPLVVMVPGVAPDATGGPAPTYPAQLFFGSNVPAGKTGIPLEQYGMEYNPIAINEVLAYSFERSSLPQTTPQSGGTPVQTNRFSVELINTLTQSAAAGYNPPPSSGTPVTGLNTSDMDLKDWDLILLPDDPMNRPDPSTGQVLDTTTFNTTNFGRIPLVAGSFSNTPTNLYTTAQDVVLRAMTTASNPFPSQTSGTTPTPGAPNPYYYYVITNPSADPTAEVSTLTTTANQTLSSQYDWFANTGGIGGAPGTSPTGNLSVTPVPATSLPAPGSGQVTYFWLCLRRPASALPLNTTTNPLDTNGIGAASLTPTSNKMVVVDSMRFPFIDAGATGVPNGDTSTNPPKDKVSAQPKNYIFSYQRLQPFRGGHSVPSAYDPQYTTSPTITDTHYGFTEQMAAPNPNAVLFTYAKYGTATNFSMSSPIAPGGGTLSANIYHTLTAANFNAEGGQTGAVGGTNGGPTGGANNPLSARDPWDYFPFYDRDFTSVTELLMVPGTPPGLFTKQFVENVPSGSGVWNRYGLYSYNINAAYSSSFTYTPVTSITSSTQNGNAMRQVSLPNSPRIPVTGSSPANPGAPYEASDAIDSGTAQTYPYMVDEFYYTAAAPASPVSGQNQNTGTPVWPTVSGPAGAGWFKMFEFLEVPSPTLGAIGEVASGFNYDWLRQDVRPGLLNLNLIIDEEVFLGLMGNAGLVNEDSSQNITPAGMNSLPYALNGSNSTRNATQTPPFWIGGPSALFTGGPNLQMQNPSELLNATGKIPETGEYDNGQVFANSTVPGNLMYASVFAPKVVTMTDPITGLPPILAPPITTTNSTVNLNLSPAYHVAAYPVNNQGFYDLAFNFGAVNLGDSRLKACFNDFLKLRHGGSGYLFAWGIGPAGTPTPGLNPTTGVPSNYTSPSGTSSVQIAAERPFRSLSFPDINYTIMRPAPLPPSAFSLLPGLVTVTAPITSPALPVNLTAGWPPPGTTPPTPFIWDPGVRNPYIYAPQMVAGAVTPPTGMPSPEVPPNLPSPIPVRRLFQIPDNPPTASQNSNNADVNSGGTFGDTFVNQQTATFTMSNTSLNPTTGNYSGGWVDLTSSTSGNGLNVALGSNGSDRRGHPFFRSEWLQRISNLTTVRSHQYAVWITVGFFEVTQAGDPKLINAPASYATPNAVQPYNAAMDQIGLELGILTGRNTRYRGFFILDRTKINGYNPSHPDDFHKAIVYRQKIE